MMTNGVSYTTIDREMEMYRKCKGDDENMGREGLSQDTYSDKQHADVQIRL